ncbi:Ldh family oxidoreductase [Puniceibacterium confluentis]|uniref:Ldh family oxidoreductase n=1 Tax=Puniceibacterium confluentis TaxID=1958944 RepID=UPI0011B3B5EB|nr:Ldh family oxidoreductase [Puniceibacterium confluentis]
MPKLSVSTATELARTLLADAGMSAAQAAAMADVLIAADLMGHRTHGLGMLPTYLDRIAAGLIRREGEIETLSKTSSTFAWHTDRLPGAWVMQQAMSRLQDMARRHPVVTATVSNCTHIGSLQVYLEEPARNGYLALMMVTDPGVASVAPFGGVDPVLTTNPIACGIPTGCDPILIDQCTSLVSNAQAQSIPEGQTELPGDWLLDNMGRPSRDPSVLKTDPPGTIMPLGGADFGYKGMGFMLMVEAFALALSGHARSTPKTRGAQGVFVQLIDPSAFSGRGNFEAEMKHVVEACHASRPAEGSSGVRLPGERALRLKREQTETGLDVETGRLDAIRAACERNGFDVPALMR